MKNQLKVIRSSSILRLHFLCNTFPVAFTEFSRPFPGVTGFYWVLLGMAGFSPPSTGFYRVFLGPDRVQWFFFTEFTGFYRVLPSFTGFYWVLLGFNGFYLVSLGFTEFSWALIGFNGFFLPSLLDFTEFCRVFRGFYRVLAGLPGSSSCTRLLPNSFC